MKTSISLTILFLCIRCAVGADAVSREEWSQIFALKHIASIEANTFARWEYLNAYTACDSSMSTLARLSHIECMAEFRGERAQVMLLACAQKETNALILTHIHNALISQSWGFGVIGDERAPQGTVTDWSHRYLTNSVAELYRQLDKTQVDILEYWDLVLSHYNPELTTEIVELYPTLSPRERIYVDERIQLWLGFTVRELAGRRPVRLKVQECAERLGRGLKAKGIVTSTAPAHLLAAYEELPEGSIYRQAVSRILMYQASGRGNGWISLIPDKKR